MVVGVLKRVNIQIQQRFIIYIIEQRLVCKWQSTVNFLNNSTSDGKLSHVLSGVAEKHPFTNFYHFLLILGLYLAKVQQSSTKTKLKAKTSY